MRRRRAQELAEEYEDFEAERRAMEKLQQQEEEGIQLAKREDTLDNMRKIKMRAEVKILEFSGAVMEQTASCTRNTMSSRG